MRFFQAAIVALVVALGFGATARAQLTPAQLEQRKRELKARHERNVAAMKQNRDAGRGHFDANQSRGGPPSSAAPQRSLAARTAGPAAPAFYASSAPPPEETLRKFMAAAREARSMEELLVYLPQGKQRALQESQANYDPKVAAENRARRKKRDPSISERTQTYLSNSPYVNALQWHQGIGKKFLDVLNVKVEGNTATIEVSTTGGGTAGGVKYPYGEATVEMVGEGRAWKFASYNDSNIMYLKPPQPKRPKQAK